MQAVGVERGGGRERGSKHSLTACSAPQRDCHEMYLLLLLTVHHGCNPSLSGLELLKFFWRDAVLEVAVCAAQSREMRLRCSHASGVQVSFPALRIYL